MKKKITLGLFLAYILFCGFLFIKTRFITPNQHLVLQSEKAQKYKKLLVSSLFV
ncbi:penicillin-binding protein [Lactobacillus helveticus]|uniref:Penicillin-binding protein n=1 Tax=Lactobacillus helveticus TaxID=1587 RepID=A0A386RGD9_LACHE|nr:penicillin-binding protein [Lactobacillus helveticus]